MSFIADALKSYFSENLGLLKQIWEFVSGIPKAIIDGILNILKTLFIPSEGYFASVVEDLGNAFKSAFNLSSFDVDVFGSEKPLTNVTSDIDIAGQSRTVTLIDYKFLLDALVTFRPIIRGFCFLLIVTYNLNQFLSLIGAGTITLGGIVQGYQEFKGEEDKGKKGIDW